jgi:hypothetical protein
MRLPTLVPGFVLSLSCVAVAACSAPSEPGPPPTDPLVYAASEETRREVGVHTWGYANDAAASASFFRAYDAKNAKIAEVRQSFVTVDEFTRRFELEMHGSAGDAVQRIDFVAHVADDDTTVTYDANVLENGFRPGSVAAQILARLEPDANGGATSLASPAASLVTKTRPLNRLVDQGPELLQCCSELSREGAQMSASAAGDCSLVQPGGPPLVRDDDGAGGDVAPQSGLAIRALVAGPNGAPTVSSPWRGPYNIVDNHCHNAASANSRGTDGYIACHATSSTTQTMGHTINWAPHPTRLGTTCAYEPQLNGGTLLAGSFANAGEGGRQGRAMGVCCWDGGAVSASGTPALDTVAARQCVQALCLGQANFDAGSGAPQAFPPGSTPPVPNDCPASTSGLSSCNACCTNQAQTVDNLFDDRYQPQIRDYRRRCAVACADADRERRTRRNANQCLSRALAARASLRASENMCRRP